MRKGKQIVSELLRPVVYLAVLLTVCVLLILGHSVATLNTMAREQGLESLAMSLDGFQQSLERVNIDYSWWDEAIDNLVLDRNQSWIDVNIGADALLTTGTDVIFAADDQNNVWYLRYTDNRDVNLEDIRTDLNVLFQTARQQPRSNPRPESGFVEINEKLYLISAAAITAQKQESSPTPISQQQHILGFLQEVDSNQLTRMGAVLRLQNLRFDTESETRRRAFIKLKSPSSSSLGALTWQSSKPGTDFLIKMTPVVGSIILIVGICTAVIGRRTTQVARRLVANEHFLEEKNQKLETSLSELAEANEQVKEASRAKTEFLTNVSHELRTPLNAIIGFSEIICEQRMGRVGNSKYVEYAQDINQSGAHLLSLINEILDLSKIKSGQFRLSLENIDLNDVVESGIKLFATQAESRNIDLTFERSSEEIVLSADERALRQILINLIGNALKFTPNGGRVTAKTELDRDSNIYLSIEDTGIGIPETEIKAALTPFQQVDGRLNRKHGGTGLGLPLSQQLAELHDGSLELESEPGHGTKVTITFPPKSLRKTRPTTQIAS